MKKLLFVFTILLLAICKSPAPSGGGYGGTSNGITNGQPSVLAGTVYAGYVNSLNPGMVKFPTRFYAFGDSISQQMRTNGWFSHGGYTNQYSSLNFSGNAYTNGTLFYNVGSYTSNNISFYEAMTNIEWVNHQITVAFDNAGCVPGIAGANIWGTFNGSNWVALPSLYATKNKDQINGFTYNARGFYTNANGFHGDPAPLTYWPDSTNDVWVMIQGTIYSNINNAPISITVTGSAYNQMVFCGTPNYTSVGYGTLPYRAGQGPQSKYAPPYTSACNAFDLNNNIPTGIWALSNAPSVTGVAAGIFFQAGNNDITGVTTNALAWTTNICNFADYCHSNGYYPVILISTVNCPGLNGLSPQVVTNFVNAERQLWQGHFDYFYDLQASNGISGMLTSPNSIDGQTHFSPTYAGYVGTNLNLSMNWNTLITSPLAAGAGGAFDGSSVTNLATSYYTNLVLAQIYTNPLTRVMFLTVPTEVSSPATTLGSAEVFAQTKPQGGTFINVSGNDIGGGATSIIATNRATLSFPVPAGWVWTVTSTVSGSGYVGKLDGSKTNTVTTY